LAKAASRARAPLAMLSSSSLAKRAKRKAFSRTSVSRARRRSISPYVWIASAGKMAIRTSTKSRAVTPIGPRSGEVGVWSAIPDRSQHESEGAAFLYRWVRLPQLG
jgi:hypothetical protein